MSVASARAVPTAAGTAAAAAPRRCRCSRQAAAPFTSSPAAPRRSQASRLPLRVAASSGGQDQQPQQPQQPPQEEYVQLGPRDDDVLPNSLTDALEDSSRATVEALERGVDRCIVSAKAGVNQLPPAASQWARIVCAATTRHLHRRAMH